MGTEDKIYCGINFTALGLTAQEARIRLQEKTKLQLRYGNTLMQNTVVVMWHGRAATSKATKNDLIDCIIEAVYGNELTLKADDPVDSQQSSLRAAAIAVMEDEEDILSYKDRMAVVEQYHGIAPPELVVHLLVDVVVPVKDLDDTLRTMVEVDEEYGGSIGLESLDSDLTRLLPDGWDVQQAKIAKTEWRFTDDDEDGE